MTNLNLYAPSNTAEDNTEIIFFSAIHGIFTKIDNGLSHKIGLKEKKSTSYRTCTLAKI